MNATTYTSANPYESPRVPREVVADSAISPSCWRSSFGRFSILAALLIGLAIGFSVGYAVGLHDGSLQGMEDLRRIIEDR
jgi:hypothetical protein